MKKILLILFFSISISINAFGHLQETHQYIVIEVLKLLELQLHKSFPELDSYMGQFEDSEYCYWGNWIDKGEIVLGAWDEDQYDPVFPGNNLMIVGQQIDWLSSTSHFWDPDKDLYNFQFYVPNTILIDVSYILRKYLLMSHPTAYSKAIYYVNGHWPPISYVMTKENDIWSGYNTCGYDYENGLINLYSTGELRKKYHWYHSKIFNIDTYTLDNNIVTWDNTKRKKLVYNILGRIAHLLGDMSIPSHAHFDIHPCALGDGDEYELWIASNDEGGCNEPHTSFRANGKDGAGEYGTGWNALTAREQGDVSSIECITLKLRVHNKSKDALSTYL